VTSLEIIYAPSGGFVVRGTNPEMRIRTAEAPDSETVHAEAFSQLVGRRSPRPSLRELWIHVGRKLQYTMPPLSEFLNLEKLVVRVTVRVAPKRNPISQLLHMLDVDKHVPCPHLSTLDLSGSVNTKYLLTVLRARSKAGCRLRKLRLGTAHIAVEDILKLGVQGYVDELKFFDNDGESCGMELPAVCTAELGKWWEPWTKHQVRGFHDHR
jgi:hypothetical protein